ncbi:hypothetical protein SAY87_006396 [Trapa incisa]|uniref:FAD-binding FR-type domain-containing protein n=1 Tax=Trapa incisa TaxID=236973 RepID=A0AAN7K0X3_9MYRT|nr:hypothetical protein SAY87_006396 [Trapa incisa]
MSIWEYFTFRRRRTRIESRDRMQKRIKNRLTHWPLSYLTHQRRPYPTLARLEIRLQNLLLGSSRAPDQKSLPSTTLSFQSLKINSSKMGVAQVWAVALLRLLMTVILASWFSVWLLKPTDLWTRKWKQAENHAGTTVFGYYGLNFAVYTFPVIALAIMGLAYLNFKSSKMRQRKSRSATITALSNPVLITSLLGVVSTVELLAMSLFFMFLAWTYYARISKDFKNLMPIKSLELNTWQLKYSKVATRSGLLAEASLALLLFPILRVMPLPQVIGIPFEVSVKYHVWLGTLMIFFATFHSASLLFIWGVSHHIHDEIWKWQKSGRIYLAGELGLLTGLVIWITSLPIIRRKRFEVFYYTHHLYMLFLLFFLFHVGDRHFYMVFPGIFLFSLDKILRIIQSRPETSILSARVFPNKAVELTIPKDSRLKYFPTSIIFVKIPRISRLQWHAFSITSSSAADEEMMTIIAKCEGAWTNDLYQMIHMELNSHSKQNQCPTISVEGPYGPPINFLRYDSLLLIAGGIGITPFLGIIQDIGSSQSHNKFMFPEQVHLIYIIKKSQDICLLSSISHLLWNKTVAKHHLKLKVYVTQEHQSDPNLRGIFQEVFSQVQAVHFNPKTMSHKAHGLGNLLETAVIALFASIMFFVFLLSLNHTFVPKENKPLKPRPKMKGLEAKQKTPSTVIDLILLASFILSIIGSTIFAIILRWRRLKMENPPISPKKATNRNLFEEDSIGTALDSLEEDEIHFGSRPNFQDIFSKFPGETGGSNVGVLVCGPESMKESVATACQGTCLVSCTKGRPKFNFHSLNFTL